MIMRKFVSLLLVLLFLTAGAYAFEKELTNFGFEAVSLTSPNETHCQTIQISIPSEELINNYEPILSIYANFVGEKSDNSYVSVKINDMDTKILWPESFVCNSDCVARVFVPELRNNNSVSGKICVVSGGKSTASLSTKSKIGLYTSPILEIENISPEKMVLGERAKMIIRVKNIGSISSDVFVQFIAQDLRAFIEITSFDIVEGDASASTTIKKGETKEFVYYIKPTKVSSYNLPSAVLFFENIFGERQKILSSHPQLEVYKPEQISLVLISSKKENIEKNKFTFEVAIKNNYDEEFAGKLLVYPTDIVNNPELEIKIPAFAEKKVFFSTEELMPGNYSVIVQVDNNGILYTSESISFSVVDNDFVFEIVFSILAILIACIIFLVIYFEKY